MGKRIVFIVVILASLAISSLGYAESSKDITQFKDANQEHPMYEEIHTMRWLGLMSGNSGYFEPDTELTRAEYAVIINRLTDFLQSREIDFDLPDLWSLRSLLDEPADHLDLEKLLGANYIMDRDITLLNLADMIVNDIELTYENYQYYRSVLDGVSNRKLLMCYSEGIFDEKLLQAYKEDNKSISLRDLIKIKNNLDNPVYPNRPDYVLYKNIPILMYHEIGILPKDGPTGLYVHPDRFKVHLDALKNNGYNAITMDQLYNHWEEGAPLPQNPIVLSFDDGYESHYTFVADELTKRGMTGTIYMITGNIGSNDIMTEDNLRRIYSNGVEIGSHTVYHIDSTRENKTRLRFEYEGSKSTLERILGEKVNTLAYPIGKYTEYVKEFINEVGYETAVTTQYGSASKDQGYLALKRIRVFYDDTENSLLKRIGN